MNSKAMRIFAAFSLLFAATAQAETFKNEAWRELTFKFPYYFTGTNKHGQSVYLVEFGKWDTGSVLEEGSSVHLLDEFYTKFFTTVIQDGQSSRSNGSILVVDAKGLDSSQTEDPKVLKFFMKQSLKFDELNKDKGIELVYVVNANKAYLDLFNAIKPSLNVTRELFKIYSENATEWCPEILSYLNLDMKSHNGLSRVAPLQVLLDEEFPNYLRSKFPYYLSGYTADGSPIFIMPLGKYDYESASDKGRDASQLLSRLMSQMFLRLYTSGLKAPGGRGAILIADLKGLSGRPSEMSNVREHMLGYYTTMDKINSGSGLKKFFVINASRNGYQKFHADTEPLLVNTREKILVFYQDQDYRPALREEVKTPIPEEYGGTSDYVPLVSY